MRKVPTRTAFLLGMTLAASEWLPGCLVADDGHPPTEGSGASAGAAAGGALGGGARPSGGGAGGAIKDAGTSGAGGVVGGGAGGSGGVARDAGTSAGGLSGGGAGGFSGGAGGFSGGVGGSAGAAGGVSTDPCTAFAFPSSYGLSCGANLGPSADPSRLYLCDGIKTTTSVVCAEGCHAAPVGQDDYCNGVDTDPCMNNTFASSTGTAVWCAGNLLSTLDPNVLYSCFGQTVSSMETCSNGCHVSPPGQADYCN